VYDSSNAAFFYAEMPTEIEGKPVDPIYFPPNFETLEEAQASAARINRNEWKLVHPEAPSTPWDDDRAKQPEGGKEAEAALAVAPKSKNRKKGEKVAEPEPVGGD